MKSKNTTLPKLFIGIDIHKANWNVHLATDLFQGKRFTSPADPLLLHDFVDKHYPNHQVYCAYEAGCCGYSAHRAFLAFGWKSLVFNTADISRKDNGRGYGQWRFHPQVYQASEFCLRVNDLLKTVSRHCL